MLTGQRAFSGETVSQTRAAVMVKEPRWETLSPDLPSNLTNAVRRCLDKGPRERMRDIGDVRLAISGAFETPVTTFPREPAPYSPWRRQALPLAFGTLVVGGLVTGLSVWSLTRQSPTPSDVVRLAIDAPVIGRGGGVALAISPDGTRIVYRGGNGTQLWLRSLDQLDPTPLGGASRIPNSRAESRIEATLRGADRRPRPHLRRRLHDHQRPAQAPRTLIWMTEVASTANNMTM